MRSPGEELRQALLGTVIWRDQLWRPTCQVGGRGYVRNMLGERLDQALGAQLGSAISWIGRAKEYRPLLQADLWIALSGYRLAA